MRFVVAIAVLAAVVLGFLLLRPSGPGPAPEGEPLEPRGGPSAPPPSRALPAPNRGLSAAPRKIPRNLPREPASAAYDRGTVAVHLVSEGGIAPSPGLRITIEALGPQIPAQPVFAPRVDGLYEATGVPAGKHRVRVFSEGAVEGIAEVEVEKDVETTIDVPLVPGGAASYSVTLPTGEAPGDVTFELLDARGRAIPAVHQTPMTTLRIVPEKPVVIPPTGKVLGLRPGKYVLRAKSAAGETAEQAFTAAAGETVSVELRVRR
jgi:hypothetical protein